MGITGRKGFLLSLDLAVAFLAMLLMLSLMMMHFESEKRQAIETVERASLQRKAVFLLDAMVKNRNEEQPLLGAAAFDAERHRVLQNELDESLLLEAEGLELENAFVSRASFTDEVRSVFLDKKQGKNCVALERTVLMSGGKGKLEVVLCEK